MNHFYIYYTLVLLLILSAGYILIQKRKYQRLYFTKIKLTYNSEYKLDGVTHKISLLPENTKAIRCLNDNCAGQLKSILRITLRILSKNKIQTWASGGTLLGVVRHNGFIPWDDDIDLHFNINDYSKLLSKVVIDELKQNNLTLTKERLSSHIVFKVVSKHGFSLDLFPTIEINKNMIATCKNYSGTKIKKKEINLKDDIFPLRKLQFEDMEIPVPNNPNPILIKQYGNSCLSEIKIKPSHWSSKILGNLRYKKIERKL